MRYIILFVLALVAAVAPQPWNMVLVSGSSAQHVFDNARDALATTVSSRVESGTTITALSADLESGKRLVSLESIEEGLKKGGKCFLYITSHGSYGKGVQIRDGYLTPEALDALLTKHCKGPTVVVISACFSGAFAGPVMQKPNRVILTAAAEDRSSFGCTNDLTYTYWDGCFLRTLANSSLWTEVSMKTAICVARLESDKNVTPSLPQFFRGDKASDNIF